MQHLVGSGTFLKVKIRTCNLFCTETAFTLLQKQLLQTDQLKSPWPCFVIQWKPPTEGRTVSGNASSVILESCTHQGQIIGTL
jgi:hypothetical protein